MSLRWIDLSALCSRVCTRAGAKPRAADSRCAYPDAGCRPTPYVSIEQEVSPEYDGETGSSSLVNVRAQLPYVAGAQYVFRLKLPIVTSAPATAVTGAGDLALYDLAVTDAPRDRWLAGVTIRIPTAQNDSLGTGKYSVGPAFGYETHYRALDARFLPARLFLGYRPRVAFAGRTVEDRTCGRVRASEGLERGAVEHDGYVRLGSQRLDRSAGRLARRQAI